MWQQQLTQILQQANYAPQEIQNVINQFNVVPETDRRAFLELLSQNKETILASLKYNLAKFKRAVVLGNVRLVKKYLKQLEELK